MAAGIVLCGSLSRWAVPLGAAMHQAGYRACSLDWHYVPFEIDEAQLPEAVAAMRTLALRGLGVSMPFKLQVMPLLDRVDPIAARIGAVNTIVNEDGVLVGHNTDWCGASRALEERRSLKGARTLVLGAGGAARAVAFGLKERGAEVRLSNRTEERAARLAREVGASTIAWDDRHRADGVDILVNASSLGMNTVDAASPFDASKLSPNAIVMDIVYKPVETDLVRQARARGLTTVNGSRMLLHQAAAQFELYTNRAAPLEAMSAALASYVQ
jgi:shikimate dehydrogenase